MVRSLHCCPDDCLASNHLYLLLLSQASSTLSGWLDKRGGLDASKVSHWSLILSTKGEATDFCDISMKGEPRWHNCSDHLLNSILGSCETFAVKLFGLSILYIAGNLPSCLSFFFTASFLSDSPFSNLLYARFLHAEHWMAQTGEIWVVYRVR